MTKIKYQLFTDGGARGNPGPAGIGAVIKKNDKIIRELKQHIGEATNNQAEYKALILGLNELAKIKVYDVDCYLDSELIVRQLSGRYKVKNKDLKILFLKVQSLLNNFKKCNFHHIPRSQNTKADKLVNEVIDEYS